MTKGVFPRVRLPPIQSDYKIGQIPPPQQSPERHFMPENVEALVHTGNHVSMPSHSENRIENIEGDPMHDDEILFHGRRLVQPGDESTDTIRKAPSDQSLMRFRWGSTQRMSGRSKSGLQIQVPSRERPVIPLTSGPLTGRSIVYQYTSSSSESGRNTTSLGAVGDHLSSCRTGFLSADPLPVLHENRPAQAGIGLSRSSKQPRSPLADLVNDSTPDRDPYKLLIVGETGPASRLIRPQLIAPSEFPLLPLRRRSLSDILETQTYIQSPSHKEISSSALPFGSFEIASSPEPPVAALWTRSGPFLEANFSQQYGAVAVIATPSLQVDPLTFSLPFGSKVFMMKTNNVHNLRASVITGVWSSTPGANRVFQGAWDDRKGDEKILFLFTITNSGQHNRKFVGMGEMNGPFDPNSNPQNWIGGLKGSEGVILLQWIVLKDVPFSAFEGLEHKGQPVTQLRHANTVPGEAGRSLVQIYFELEHAATAIIHPVFHAPDVPSISPSKTQDRKRRLPAPRIATISRRPSFPHGSQRMMPYYSHQPVRGPATAGMMPHYPPVGYMAPTPRSSSFPPYSNHAPSSNACFSSSGSYGDPTDSRHEANLYPTSGCGSLTFNL